MNRDQIESQIKDKHYEKGDVLIRFPLPLAAYIGQVIPFVEFEKIKGIIDGLGLIKEESGGIDHRRAVRDLLDDSVLPVDMVYRDALSIIVRNEESYYLELE